MKTHIYMHVPTCRTEGRPTGRSQGSLRVEKRQVIHMHIHAHAHMYMYVYTGLVQGGEAPSTLTDLLANSLTCSGLAKGGEAPGSSAGVRVALGRAGVESCCAFSVFFVCLSTFPGLTTSLHSTTWQVSE